MPDLFKGILPSILVRQDKELWRDDPDYTTYVPYVVNLALSYHIDTVMQANEMNKRPDTPARAQYLYLVNTIRKYKRPYVPWNKRETLKEVEAVMRYYGHSRGKAIEALQLLTDEQKSYILNCMGEE